MIEVTTEHRAMVERLAQSMVASAAPEELAFFPATFAAFFERRSGAPRSSGPDDMLGYGWAEVVHLVSPIAIAVAMNALNHVTDETGKAVARRGIGILRSLRRWLWKSSKFADEQRIVVELPYLSQKQEAELAELARCRARELGLDDERTDRLVAALLDAFGRAS